MVTKGLREDGETPIDRHWYEVLVLFSYFSSFRERPVGGRDGALLDRGEPFGDPSAGGYRTKGTIWRVTAVA